MALKLPDSAVPMGDFPVAKAVDIDFDDGENLQDKLDNGKLGGGSVDLTDIENRLDTLEENKLDNESRISELETKMPRVFYSESEINKAHGTNISLVVGEDNTEKIINVLEPYEEFINWFGNTTSTDRFGIDKSMGTRLNVISIQRCTGNEGFAYAITNEGKLLSRFFQDGVLSEWDYDKTDLSDLENRVTTNEADITNLQEQIDNLDIPDITDINDRLSKLEDKRVYNSIEELNTAKGLSISFTKGEDNTMKIVDALSPIETFADYFGNSINDNRFGIDTNTYGSAISLLSITKFDSNIAIIRAYMSNGKLLVRRYQNGVLGDWQYDKTDLSEMNTKISQLETQVSDLFQSVSDGKTLVANAITDKGVSTATDATFATMASNISKINTNGYKEETESWDKTSTGANRIVFTFSADVYGVKQITPPSDASSHIVPETLTSMFTINGRKLTLYVNGVGTWKVTAIVRNA